MSLEMTAAIGAIIVSVAGAIFNYYKFKDDQKTWEEEQKISMNKKILFKILKKRYQCYGNIFKLLGEVRDIDYPLEHYKLLEKNKEKIIITADLILNELYGEAGLFMSYETRSAILKTYQNSYRYSRDEIELNELIDSYYISRRLIRKDLEFDDSKSAQSSKKILALKTDIEEGFENKIKWSKKGILAYSPRPGYPNKVVSLKMLNRTINKWKENGIKSIICLLSNEEINEYYKVINYNLIDFYKKHGFLVYHLSITDFQKPPVNKEELVQIEVGYSKLISPILIHCGAGEDRSGCVVEYFEDKYAINS